MGRISWFLGGGAKRKQILLEAIGGDADDGLLELLKASEESNEASSDSLFTTEVENCTSVCTQLYCVESIRIFVLTDATGSYCKGGLHSLLARRSGLRSVFWTFSRSRNAVLSTWLHLQSCYVI